MNTSLLRLLLALSAFTFVVAACASDTGSQWTFAPASAASGESSPSSANDVPVEESAQAVEAAEAEAEEAPAVESAMDDAVAEEEPAEPEEPVAPPSGEPRIIELQADSALRFTDASGQPVSEIPVTPGETVIFSVDNTAGFAHNLWVGTDAELSVPSATTDVGIPDWTTGVQEFEWVVPDDITGLRFACTVPGHYFSMSGDFSLADTAASAGAETAAVEAVEAETSADAAAVEEPADAAASEDAAAAEEPVMAEDSAAAANGEPRVIELEADAAIRFLQDGEQIRELEVTPGETVLFRVDNTAGFPHNLYIGSDEELRVMGGVTDVGIPDWNLGVQELEWVVPEDLTDIRFACTVPGHYFTMQGDFIVSA